jgi:transcriptional regulator with GAF, ATPase, and Fis domain
MATAQPGGKHGTDMMRQDYLNQIVALVGSVFDAYSSVLFLADGDAAGGQEPGPCRVAAHFSLGDTLLADACVEPGKGVVGWILRNRAPLLINNFDQQQSHLGYYRGGEEGKIKAFMGCPLDQGAGVICLDSKRTYSFSEKDQKLLHLFAQLVHSLNSQFSSAREGLCQSNHYAALQMIQGLRRRITRWSAFLESYLSLLAEASGFEYCFFAARDERGATYSLEGTTRSVFPGSQGDARFKIGTGLVGYVFKNGAPVYAGKQESSSAPSPLFGKDVKTPKMQSVVCLPLHVHRATRGVLGLASETPVPVTDDLKVFLNMASDHLALFLENLYLRSRLGEAEAALQQVSGGQKP